MSDNSVCFNISRFFHRLFKSKPWGVRECQSKVERVDVIFPPGLTVLLTCGFTVMIVSDGTFTNNTSFIVYRQVDGRFYSVSLDDIFFPLLLCQARTESNSRYFVDPVDFRIVLTATPAKFEPGRYIIAYHKFKAFLGVIVDHDETRVMIYINVSRTIQVWKKNSPNLGPMPIPNFRSRTYFKDIRTKLLRTADLDAKIRNGPRADDFIGWRCTGRNERLELLFRDKENKNHTVIASPSEIEVHADVLPATTLDQVHPFGFLPRSFYPPSRNSHRSSVHQFYDFLDECCSENTK